MIVDPERDKSYTLTYQQSIQRKSGVSEVKYIITIELFDTLFSGKCEIEFDYSSGELWLDFNGGEITKAEINEQQVSLTWLRSKIFLKDLIVGSNRVRIEYLRPYSKDGYGLHHFTDVDESVYIYSNFEPFHANKTFPCFDQPDIKASFVMNVGCPSHWKVISNQVSLEVTKQDGISFHRFQETAKISTYLVALVAGDYHEVRLDDNETGIPLGLYCRKTFAEVLQHERYFKWTIRGFKFYQDMFDIRYPFVKYDQVFVPEYNAGAMENVGCVTFKEDYLCVKGTSTELCLAATTFLHEMSHMWFGNLVTMKWWDDLWLNESFATYLSYLAVDSCLSDDFHQSWILFLRRKSFSYLADQKKTTHPISSHVENTSQTRSIFDAISYGKGAAVIKQLVFLIGFENFKFGLSEYLKENSYSNTEFKDLIEVLGRRTPDLQSWAKSWIQTSGVNTLVPVLGENKITITQRAQGTCQLLKSHDLLYECFDENGTSFGRNKIRIEDEVTDIHTDINPACLILNSEDHGYCKVILEQNTLNFVKYNLRTIADPLNRMQLIVNLSEMVNECLVSPMEFLEIIASHTIFETEPAIGVYMLNLASTTLQNKIKDKMLKKHFYRHFNEKILQNITLCPEFQDLILSFLFTDDQILQAVGWLNGESPITLTQHRRWRILKTYSRISADAKALVDSEQDNTREGLLERLYCESVYPSAETKEKAWEKFMNGCQGLSRFQRKSAMGGFVKRSQRDLLEKYADLYFDEVLEICEKFEFEYALDFSTLLFPDFKDEVYLKAKVENLLPTIKPENVQLIKMFRDRLEIIERDNKIKTSLVAEEAKTVD